MLPIKGIVLGIFIWEVIKYIKSSDIIKQAKILIKIKYLLLVDLTTKEIINKNEITRNTLIGYSLIPLIKGN